MADPHSTETTVIVNGTPKTVSKKDELTFDEIVRLAFDPIPTGENILITVAYRRGHASKPQGTVLPGGSVKIVHNMVFDVTATDKS
jgi:hypothetical protein